MITEIIKFQIGVDVLGFPIYHYHKLSFKLVVNEKEIFNNTCKKLPSKYIINKLYRNKKI